MQNNELTEMISAAICCLPSEKHANIAIVNSFSKGKLIRQKITSSYSTNVGKEPVVQQEATDAPMTIDELMGQEEPEEAEEEPEEAEEEAEEPEENMIVSFEEIKHPAATRAQYGCKYCGKDCKTKSAMQQHIKYHHVWYKCAYPTCRYESKMKSQISIHMDRAHRSQYYANANKCIACLLGGLLCTMVALTVKH